MDLLGIVALADFIAKPLHLRLIGHIGDVRGNPQALRQPRGFAKLPGFLHRRPKDIAHRDIAGFGDQLADQLPAHPRTAAGDHRDLPCEISHVAPRR